MMRITLTIDQRIEQVFPSSLTFDTDCHGGIRSGGVTPDRNHLRRLAGLIGCWSRIIGYRVAFTG